LLTLHEQCYPPAGLRAARKLHEALLTSVLSAPAAFFDACPPGRLLNRFSSDTSTADDSLPFILNILLACAVSLGGLVAVLGYAQPLLLPGMVVLAVAYR
jgi:ATP-binding cassette, subfamily C (CFTR/MRP), member 10